MGIACGKPTLDAEISRAIAKEAKNEKKVKKLLLLGAGESGKSTILKQIRFLFKAGFSESERKSYVPVIHANIYQSIKTLFIGCKQFADIEEGDGSSIYTLQPENEEFVTALLESDDPDKFPSLNEETAIKVLRFWRDPAIQAAYARANEMQLPDCTFFFLENVVRLAGIDYTPTPEDVLYARQQTTGIVEIDFSPEFGKKSGVYKLFDVGGQRNERMKWIHLFDGVTAIIFCVALSEYDQMLAEDDTKNRMVETMELFDWILKQEWFEKTSFLLFLNKFDLFKEKVRKVPLSVCEWFHDYQPSPLPSKEVEHAYEFIKQKFQAIYERNTPSNNVNRVFDIYKTTALDESLIKTTFNLVNEALTRDMLTDAGLL